MNIEEKEFTIGFVRKMLGTIPKDPNVLAAYIASKTADESKQNEEVETVPERTAEETEMQSWTGFHQDDNGLFIYEYMIKGWIKTAIEVLQNNGTINKIVAYKKCVDTCVFIEPRRLYFNKPKADGFIERPIRAMTAKGERVSVTRSDYIEEGTQITFAVKILKNNRGLTMKVFEQLLPYGSFVGLGQWRGSGGYGRFIAV